MSTAPPEPTARRGRKPLELDEEVLRRLWGEGQTDAEIGAAFGVSARTVRERRGVLGLRRDPPPARGEARGPGLLLRCDSLEQREAVHAAARAAGRDTSEWLLELALTAPALARVARAEGRRRAGQRALADLLELLAGPEDRGGEGASGE